jgi:hypothetical protein
MHVVSAVNRSRGAPYRCAILDDVLTCRDICESELVTKVNVAAKNHGSSPILHIIPGSEINNGSRYVVLGVNDNELPSF